MFVDVFVLFVSGGWIGWWVGVGVGVVLARVIKIDQTSQSKLIAFRSMMRIDRPETPVSKQTSTVTNAGGTTHQLCLGLLEEVLREALVDGQRHGAGRLWVCVRV